jgi:enamine deaminase RidA (YjgF/YER057c/UK114 family)
MAKIVTPKAFGPPLGLYSHGVIAPAGELVVVAGQVGVGPSGGVSGDIVGQTKQAFDNVRVVLEAAGCTLRDVIRLQTFLTRADDIPGFMKAREEVFAEHYPNGGYPPNTLLIVSRLVKPELHVEIEAMAVRPARSASAPSRAVSRATSARGATRTPRPRAGGARRRR